MKFLIVGHVVHKLINGNIYAYGPYVREMNLWIKYVDEVIILAPFTSVHPKDPIDIPFDHENITLAPVKEFNTTSFSSKIQTVINLPGILLKTWNAMKRADHIHLRCPGNMGLVGSLVQGFFPKKLKTAKYAGNWDKSSSQPFTYQLQQKILGNTNWTKNIAVLVYGEWPNETKNIRPFFTASYSEKEIKKIEPRALSRETPIKLMFVGTLDTGKQPLLSIQVCQQLLNSGWNTRLDLYGEGELRSDLEEYIIKNKLADSIQLHGNQPAEKVKIAYQEAHFLIFISRSEGWPKAVAEAMFWGCLPVTTAVSCVPQMLGFGERGELVEPNVDEVVQRIGNLVANESFYKKKVMAGINWSQQFTLESFEEEIKNLLKNQPLEA